MIEKESIDLNSLFFSENKIRCHNPSCLEMTETSESLCMHCGKELTKYKSVGEFFYILKDLNGEALSGGTIGIQLGDDKSSTPSDAKAKINFYQRTAEKNFPLFEEHIQAALYIKKEVLYKNFYDDYTKSILSVLTVTDKNYIQNLEIRKAIDWNNVETFLQDLCDDNVYGLLSSFAKIVHFKKHGVWEYATWRTWLYELDVLKSDHTAVKSNVLKNYFSRELLLSLSSDNRFREAIDNKESIFSLVYWDRVAELCKYLAKEKGEIGEAVKLLSTIAAAKGDLSKELISQAPPSMPSDNITSPISNQDVAPSSQAPTESVSSKIPPMLFHSNQAFAARAAEKLEIAQLDIDDITKLLVFMQKKEVSVQVKESVFQKFVSDTSQKFQIRMLVCNSLLWGQVYAVDTNWGIDQLLEWCLNAEDSSWATKDLRALFLPTELHDDSKENWVLQLREARKLKDREAPEQFQERAGKIAHLVSSFYHKTNMAIRSKLREGHYEGSLRIEQSAFNSLMELFNLFQNHREGTEDPVFDLWVQWSTFMITRFQDKNDYKALVTHAFKETNEKWRKDFQRFAFIGLHRLNKSNARGDGPEYNIGPVPRLFFEPETILEYFASFDDFSKSFLKFIKDNTKSGYLQYHYLHEWINQFVDYQNSEKPKYSEFSSFKEGSSFINKLEEEMADSDTHPEIRAAYAKMIIRMLPYTENWEQKINQWIDFSLDNNRKNDEREHLYEIVKCYAPHSSQKKDIRMKVLELLSYQELESDWQERYKELGEILKKAA